MKLGILGERSMWVLYKVRSHHAVCHSYSNYCRTATYWQLVGNAQMSLPWAGYCFPPQINCHCFAGSPIHVICPVLFHGGFARTLDKLRVEYCYRVPTGIYFLPELWSLTSSNRIYSWWFRSQDLLTTLTSVRLGLLHSNYSGATQQHMVLVLALVRKRYKPW